MVLFAAKITLTLISSREFSSKCLHWLLILQRYFWKQNSFTIFINIGGSDIHQQQFMKKFKQSKLKFDHILRQISWFNYVSIFMKKYITVLHWLMILFDREEQNTLQQSEILAAFEQSLFWSWKDGRRSYKS